MACPDIPFCHASQSQVFGLVQDPTLSERTSVHRCSIYAAAKPCDTMMLGNCCESFGVRASFGTLSVHESSLRRIGFLHERSSSRSHGLFWDWRVYVCSAILTLSATARLRATRSLRRGSSCNAGAGRFGRRDRPMRFGSQVQRSGAGFCGAQPLRSYPDGRSCPLPAEV